MHPKNEIVAVARGFFALPLIVTLAKRGVTAQLMGGGLKRQDLQGNAAALDASLTYLSDLGWITQRDGLLKATELGAKVFRRAGAFGILYSYRHYFEHLETLLFDEQTQVEVNREENVVGSGAAHTRKFFSRVEHIISETRAEWILDIGCGDGTFLNYAKSINPKLQMIGVDLSEKALAVTRSNVGDDAILFKGSVSEPLAIGAELERKGVDVSKVLVSVWFIFHEVLGFDGVELGQLLAKYRQLNPGGGLIIGEIFEMPTDLLATHHNDTAIPEFSYFHALSGQRLLSQKAWMSAINGSAFHTHFFLGLDALSIAQGTSYGSGIWHLA